MAARSSPISVAKASGSRALPHKTRWRPRSHKSPIWLIGGSAETSGTASAGSSSCSGHVIERGDPQIDLGHLEAGDLEAEIEPEEREVLELLGQQPVVPGGDFGQPVVGDRKGASLGRRQVIEAERRYLAPAEL